MNIAHRAPRPPANSLSTVLRQQLPLLLACAALIAVCGFVLTAAQAHPGLA